jgi:hypothetical protein
MVRNKKPPVALQLPVALLALVLASAATADHRDGRSERAEIPPYVTTRTEILIHERTAPRPAPVVRATERQQ